MRARGQRVSQPNFCGFRSARGFSMTFTIVGTGLASASFSAGPSSAGFSTKKPRRRTPR